MTQYAPLLTALRALASSNAAGFEGFVRDLLEAVFKRTFRLVKAGPQGGKDAVAETHAISPGIAVEAKRFGAQTNLPLDELTSKLEDSIRTMPDLDVWILALSREMKEPDWSQLVQVGVEAGVTVVCLDWRTEPGSLSKLAALCAAGRYVTERRLAGDLKAALDEIVDHPTYPSVIDELRQQLAAPEVGYGLARGAAASWLHGTVTSLDRARQRLRSFADIRGPNAHFAARPGIAQKLTAWLSVGPTAPAVVLGDEGVGKTWAALDWVLRQTELPNAPLVLAISARDVQGADPSEIMAAAMLRFAPHTGATHLQRRLNRWVTSPSCRFLLLIDGLNEAWDKEWAEIVRRFDTDPWRDRVSLLLACRGPTWRDHLLRLQGTTTNVISEIEAAPFSDNELNDYLRTFGLDRNSFSQALLELIRTPRFAGLAIAMHERLGATEHVTLAHLVLEDWRSRIERRGPELRISNDQLLTLVADLGRDVLGDADFSLSQAEVHARLAGRSGENLAHYRATIDELVGGAWLASTDQQHVYQVDKRLLPYAIGLDLSRRVQSLTGRAAVEQTMAEYLDTLRGGDIGVAILRAATTIAFAQGKSAPIVLETLLKTWLSAQNFGAIDFDEMWRLIPLQPSLVLDLAQAHWAKYPVTPREGELFAKGLANAAEIWSAVQSLLVQRFPGWVGSFGIDPVRWHHSVVPYDEERAAATIARLSQWSALASPDVVRISSCLRRDADDYLSEAALSIVSFLPRQPFIDTIVTWAVTRAIMNETFGIEQFRWLLRKNPHDQSQLEGALIGQIELLNGLSDPIASDAARLIAEALATPRALASVSPSETQPGHGYSSAWPTVSERNEIVWFEPTESASLRPSVWLHRIGHLATNTRATLSQEDQTQLEAHLLSDDLERDFGNSMLAAARWAPDTLAAQLQQTAAAFPAGNIRDQTQTVRDLTEASIVLRPCDHVRLGTATSEQIEHFDEATETSAKWNAHTLYVLSMLSRSATEQIAALADLLPQFCFSTELANILAPPRPNDVASVFDALRSTSDERVLASWLGYLTCVELPSVSHYKDTLLFLCQHPALNVRVTAMEIIFNAGDMAMGVAFAGSDWRHLKGQERIEAVRGSLLLAKFGTKLDIHALRARILPDALSYAVQVRGNRPDEVRILFDYLIELLDEEIAKKRGAQRQGYEHFPAKDAWRAAIALDPELIFVKYREAVQAGMMVGFFDILPLCQILSVLFELDPVRGAELWELSRHRHRRFRVAAVDFDRLPFVAPHCDPVYRLWQSLLDDAHNDVGISEIVFWCLRAGGEGWLLQQIRGGLAASTVERKARALTMAAFLDDTPAARTLWESEIALMHLGGWMAHVRSQARAAYDRNVFARFWLTRYFDAADANSAYGHLNLFHACVDDRAVFWATSLIQSERGGQPPNRTDLLDLTLQKRQRLIKKHKDDLKRGLYFTKTCNDIAPWF